MSNPIKAVIFDCFGVLTTDGWLAFKHKYFARDEQKQEEATDYNRQNDSGFITHDEFVARIAELAGVSHEEVVGMIDSHVRNDALFEYIQEHLKHTYKIGLLSNASADWTTELFEQWQRELFDAMTFSYELGVVKPHEAMYETIAHKLDLLPEDCVFIDDREAFVTGARDAGMRSFLFVDNQQCQRELEAILAEN